LEGRKLDNLFNPNCTFCGLNEHTDNVCISGIGPQKARIMIIGEAPGASEEKQGKPFQGRAGQYLTRCLDAAGIDRKDVYITNAVHCRPPENRTPTNPEIRACKPYLLKEIERINPEYILVMGATAYKAIFNKSGIMEARGTLYELDGRKVFVTVHPAAALRQPKIAPMFEMDIVKFSDITRGKMPTESEIEWTYVDTIKSLKDCLRDIYTCNELVYDFEASSLDPLRADSYVYCLGMTTENHTWCIPFNYMGSPFSSGIERGLWGVITPAFTRPGVKLIAHNGKYDGKWFISKNDTVINQTFDTMLASHLLDENRLHGLKSLAKVYFNASNYEIKFPIKELLGVSREEIRALKPNSIKYPDTPDIKKLCKYCAFDTHYTRLTYLKFRDELKEDKALLRIFKKWTIPASNMLQRMEVSGVHINFQEYQRVMSELEGTTATLLTKLNSLADNRVKNWNSTQQVAKFLFEDLGLPILEYTSTGKPSTSGESVLPQLAGYHPVVQALLDYRENIKLQQFIASWGEHMDQNYRMHPTFKVHGTVTGRLSCTEPNLQQVPRDPKLRSLISAPEGWTLVEADYSQAELRVAAMMANDTTMKLAYQTGQDIHAKTASSVMGIPMDQVDKANRKKAKAVNFGFLYGMSAKKFQIYARDKYQVDLSMAEASRFRDRFFEIYSCLLSWHEKQRMLVRKYGYVRSLIGRKRRLPDVYSDDRGAVAEAERQAINSPVQGLASDWCVYAMIRLCQEFGDDVFRPVGLVHDATLSMVRNDMVKTIAPRIKEIMEDMDTVEEVFHCRVTVPIVADVSIGPWGKGQDLESWMKENVNARKN
jgi:DNA polymerase-1